MATRPSRTTTAPRRNYEDFEPRFEWVPGEAMDTLLIYLPGFRSNQIKLLRSNDGILRASGERPVDGRRWSRFYEEFQIPENCSMADIKAKFENETLQVRFPKRMVRDDVPAPAQPPATTQKAETKQQPEDSDVREKRQKENGKSTESADAREEPGKEKKNVRFQDNEEAAGKGITQKENEKNTASVHAKEVEDKEKEEKFDAKEKVEKKEERFQAREEIKEKEEVAGEGKSRDDKPNGENKLQQQQQQVSSKLTTDDEPSDEQKTAQQASSKRTISGEEMASYSVGDVFMGLSRSKKELLLNVAVAILVLLGVGLYVKYKLIEG